MGLGRIGDSPVRPLHPAASTATTIPAAVFGPSFVVVRRIWRVLGSGLTAGALGAPGEHQGNAKGGKASVPVHPLVRPSRYSHSERLARAGIIIS